MIEEVEKIVLEGHLPPVAMRRAVEFALPTGTCLVVSGPSGVGKTTFLRQVADLVPHDGVVTLDGKRQGEFPAPLWRQRVLYVASQSGWWAPLTRDHFTVDETLLALLDKLALPESKLGLPPADLSSGERQRMSLARALVRKPDFLLLDKPTSALDPEAILKVEHVLDDTIKAGSGLVVVSHDVAQAERLADARLVIEATA